MLDFFEEMSWRGLLFEKTKGVEDCFGKGPVTAYIGFDPTARSLHVGSLVPIITLSHLQRCGHRPIVLIGGATGLIGDPSGKSKERPMLSEEDLQANIQGIKAQLEKFIDFDHPKNPAILLNNYDWIKNLSVLAFIRDIGKSLTVNYMMAKESVKKRLHDESTQGMSFTEFTYQLFQAYDFLYLYENYQCHVQLGGQDQWGNITSGVELIRKKIGQAAHGITMPLVTKSDGTKFGKTEAGNIWLDAQLTSPYKFYQFWLNATDEDALDWIKKFTFFSQDKIAEMVERHREAPHKRIVQKALAETLTHLVHSQEALKRAEWSSRILFGEATEEELRKLDAQMFRETFEGVPMVTVATSKLREGWPIVEALTAGPQFLKSKSEANRALQEGSVLVNKGKVSKERVSLTEKDLISGKYILLQRGKKNFYIIEQVNDEL